MGSHELRNRIVRSATYEGLASADGRVGKAYRDLYVRLARLGPGSLVTGFAFVSQEGRAMQPFQAGAADDRNLSVWQEMTREVHAHGAKIYLQIAHAGRQTAEDSTGMPVVAPGAVRSPYFRSRPRELLDGEIPDRVEQFVQSARIAEAAGFDGVQIHAAHGYLVHQFLTPAVNRRRDRWGVDPRTGIGALFLEEVVGGIRKACRADFDIWVKASHGDELRGGMDARRWASLLEVLKRLPVDLVETSCGTMEHAFNIFRGRSLPLDLVVAHNPRYRIRNRWLASIWKAFAAPFAALPLRRFAAGYNLGAAAVAKASGISRVAAVGGMRDGRSMEDALRSGACDLVSTSRPFLAEPDFVRRLSKDPAHVSACEDCNRCAVLCDSPAPTICHSRGTHGKTR